MYNCSVTPVILHLKVGASHTPGAGNLLSVVLCALRKSFLTSTPPRSCTSGEQRPPTRGCRCAESQVDHTPLIPQHLLCKVLQPPNHTLQRASTTHQSVTTLRKRTRTRLHSLLHFWLLPANKGKQHLGLGSMCIGFFQPCFALFGLFLKN